MSQQNLTGEEVKIIAIAALHGKDYLPVEFHGEIVNSCGTCGRMIHHPECAQLALERADAEHELAGIRSVADRI